MKFCCTLGFNVFKISFPGKKDIKAKEKEMQALRNELDSHNAQTVVSELKERHRVQLRDLRSEIEKKSDEVRGLLLLLIIR